MTPFKGDNVTASAMAVCMIEARYVLAKARGTSPSNVRAALYEVAELISEVWWAAVHQGLIAYYDRPTTEPID